MVKVVHSAIVVSVISAGITIPAARLLMGIRAERFVLEDIIYRFAVFYQLQ